nr:MAG TPA: hypothetical protein [Caudoviricetes sp.]
MQKKCLRLWKNNKNTALTCAMPVRAILSYYKL